MKERKTSAPLTDRFCEALDFATRLHAEQRRKVSGTPYIAHLLAVAAMVIEHGGDEDEAIAALLHDAIEDQGGEAARQEIRRRFGDRVVEIVEGDTDADTVPKPPWRERKESFIERLRHASPSARLLTAADKLHNVRCLTRDLRLHGGDLWQHFHGGRDGTLWYYRAVLDTLKQHGPCPIVDELERAVSELERAAHYR